MGCSPLPPEKEALGGVPLAGPRPVSGRILDVFRGVRRCRRAAGWRPCRGMDLAAAVQDVRSLLYMLVDLGGAYPP